jgi:hypothetical protein
LKRLLLILISGLAGSALAQSAPLVIAWQAPPGPGASGFNPTPYTSHACTNMTQYKCFLSAVLPNVSGIGVIIPWGVLDNCSSQSVECQSDATCSGNCFQWGKIDTNLWNNYVNYTGTINGAPFNFNTACAGGRPCKVVFIVWLTQDSGNLNTFGGVPNTPLYVFQEATPQDVVVCISRQGGSGTGWTGAPPIIDSAWSGGGGAGDYGLWNQNHRYLLPGHSASLQLNPAATPPFTNFSGYPVMYEAPITSAVHNFLSALALHYSSACLPTSCGNGPAIAPYVAYMRIGLSSGGENYPYCACASSTGGSQCDTSYWPGPKGYDGGEPNDYSDQGYLTEWPAPLTDGTGYVASLYKFIQSLPWAFPIDTPAHTGPASNQNMAYSDTEALLASQYGLGMGMQAASIGDLVTSAAQHFPLTTANWATHFREFPYVPDHHLQTMNPGSPMQAAQFTISSSGGISSTGLISCSGAANDCSVFCTAPPWIFISGTSNPAFNGIWEVNPSQSGCGTGQIQLVGTIPPGGSNGGMVYSGAHLPVLLPFETQQCQGSFQTICSAELWEESLDWAYGTNTVSNTIGNTSTGDPAYQTAINNFLLGLPSATSMHNHMSSTNVNQY